MADDKNTSGNFKDSGNIMLRLCLLAASECCHGLGVPFYEYPVWHVCPQGWRMDLVEIDNLIVPSYARATPAIMVLRREISIDE